MPKIQENQSQYLACAMENLRRLQELKLLDDYDNFVAGYNDPRSLGNPRVFDLSNFLAEQYLHNDPALHVEYLRSKASTFKAPGDKSEEEAKTLFMTKMNEVVDELRDLLADGKMVSTTYRLLKGRLTGDDRDAMMLKYERSAYDVVSALFSIAVHPEYTDQAKILDILCDMEKNPTSLIRSNYVQEYKNFVVQNIKAIGEVYCDDRKLVLLVISKLRNVHSADSTLIGTFLGIKSEFIDSGDSQRAMTKIIETVSANLNIVDVCDYGINLLYEVSTRNTFGDAMFYMNYFDTLGFVSPDTMFDMMSLTLMTNQSRWLKLYDPYQAPGYDTYKDEYINKGVPQFKQALMAMYAFVKSHKDMHDEYATKDYEAIFRDRLHAMPAQLSFLNGKCFEILNMLDGKKPTEIIDLAVERFQRSTNDFERTCILSTIFELLPIYCKEGNIDKFVDCIDKIKDFTMIAESFVTDLTKLILIHYPMLKENQDQLTKIFHTIIPKLAIEGVHHSKIFQTFSEYIINHHSENWEENSLNTMLWSSLVDIFISPDVENDEQTEKYIINTTFAMMGTAPDAKRFMTLAQPFIEGCAKKESNNALPGIIDSANIDRRAKSIFYDRANTLDGVYVCVDEIIGILSLEAFIMRKKSWSMPPLIALSDLLVKSETMTKDNGDNARPDLEKYIYDKLVEYRQEVMSANVEGKLTVPKEHLDAFEAWMGGCLTTAYNYENQDSPLYDNPNEQQPQPQQPQPQQPQGNEPHDEQPKKKKYHNDILNDDDDF